MATWPMVPRRSRATPENSRGRATRRSARPCGHGVAKRTLSRGRQSHFACGRATGMPAGIQERKGRRAWEADRTRQPGWRHARSVSAPLLRKAGSTVVRRETAPPRQKRPPLPGVYARSCGRSPQGAIPPARAPGSGRRPRAWRTSGAVAPVPATILRVNMRRSFACGRRSHSGCHRAPGRAQAFPHGQLAHKGRRTVWRSLAAPCTIAPAFASRPARPIRACRTCARPRSAGAPQQAEAADHGRDDAQGDQPDAAISG